MNSKRQLVGQLSRMHNIAYGVSYLNEITHFKVRSESDDCYLNLYHIEQSQKDIRIQMSQEEEGIFSCSVTNLNREKYRYCFETKEETFLESNAKVVLGRDVFGKKVSPTVLRAAFLSEFPEFEREERPVISYTDMIMYKLHVRGFTKHNSSGVTHSGTYLGVVEKIPYLLELGINTVLLMPITEFDEILKSNSYRSRENIVNYWGYESQCYFYAPKASYAANTKQPDYELKQMIRELHKNQMNCMMEMNFPSWVNPITIVDCLEYWSKEYHIDGFKLNVPDQYRSMIAASEGLKHVKLMDCGWNLDEIKHFTGGTIPEGLAEYNDQFLIDARKFLKGEESMVLPFMNRVKYNKAPVGVVNYITNHDGFTLQDVYSYDRKHNEANHENNFDGREYNFSWNCGVEGDTKSKKVLTLRNKMIQNAFLALLLSQGTPLILAGDEFGNSQKGNNNGYCQDNELSWLNWKGQEKQKERLQFVKALIELRKSHPVFHQENPLRLVDYAYCGMPDLSFHGVKAWQPDFNHYSRELGVLLCGSYVSFDRRNFDDTFYLIYNMHWEAHEFGLPNPPTGKQWWIYQTTDPMLNQSSRLKNPLSDQRILKVSPKSCCLLISK